MGSASEESKAPGGHDGSMSRRDTCDVPDGRQGSSRPTGVQAAGASLVRRTRRSWRAPLLLKGLWLPRGRPAATQDGRHVSGYVVSVRRVDFAHLRKAGWGKPVRDADQGRPQPPMNKCDLPVCQVDRQAHRCCRGLFASARGSHGFSDATTNYLELALRLRTHQRTGQVLGRPRARRVLSNESESLTGRLHTFCLVATDSAVHHRLSLFMSTAVSTASCSSEEAVEVTTEASIVSRGQGVGGGTV